MLLSLLQLKLPYVVDVCIQLASGVKQIHASGVVHRDLRTDNALVASIVPLVVKWTDFSVSVKRTMGHSAYGGSKSALSVVDHACKVLTDLRVSLWVLERAHVTPPRCRVSGNQYTTFVAPIAWRACETFAPHKSAGMVVLAASDVFMLGCAFIEVLTGCSRTPFDWLKGEQLLLFRGNDSTRGHGPIVVCLSSA